MFYVQKHKDAISNGLSQMSFGTLYKAFKALLASCEAACHEVATSLWQVEASEHMSAFNQALHQENKMQLNLKDEQLKKIRNIFSKRDCTEIDDNTNYCQAVYNDEREMLCAITAKAETISKHLGPHTKHELLASTSEAPYLPHVVNTLQNGDSITCALCGNFNAGTNTDTNFSKDDDFSKDSDSSR
jgi:hypothetical protein